MKRESLRKDQDESADQAQTSALELIKSLGAAAGVLAGLAFVNGWLYWATYYTAFGLNSLVLDLPFSVVSISLVQVLWRDWETESGLVKLLLILVVLGGIALMSLFVYRYHHRHLGATVFLAILTLGLSAGAIFLGYHDARLDVGCASRLPTITFELINPPDKADPPPPCLEGSGDACHLVLHFNGTYHYFVAPDQQFCGNALDATGAGHMTYDVSDAQIRIANIQTHIGW